MKANPKMVTLAREVRGISQTQLADLIDNLSQGNLSRMEKGILTITDEILQSMATVLNFPLNFFYQEEVKTPISNFYYRKRVTMPKKAILLLEAKMNIIRKSIDYLLESIEIPDCNIPSFDIEGYTDKKRYAAEVARRIRAFMKISAGPIDDLIGIFENHGILVHFIGSVHEKFDGITLFSDKGQPIIFINKDMPNDRKRFTLAHELGHLVLHIPFVLDLDRDEEAEANIFSAEFNMPELDVRNDLYHLNMSKLGQLKDYWKMSKAAIIYRAKNIGVLNDQKYKYLNIELSRRGERKKETGSVELREPRLLKEILTAYQQQLGYSLVEISELLKIGLSDLNELFFPDNQRLRIVRV